MVVAPFGFSAGDFLSAIELVGKAAKALKETSGATRQFQQASVDLVALNNVLTRVQRLQPGGTNGDIVQTVHLCAHTCHLPLKRFLSEVKKLEPLLQLSKPASKRPLWRSSIKKIDWAINLEKELAKLKASISPQLVSIGLLLQLEALNDASNTRATVDQGLALTRELLNKVDYVKVWMSNALATGKQLSTFGNSIDTLRAEQYSQFSTVNAILNSTHSSVGSIEQRLSALEAILQHSIHGSSFRPASVPDVLSSPWSPQVHISAAVRIDSAGVDQRQIISLCHDLLQAIRAQSAAIVFAICALLLRHAVRTWALLLRGPTLILDTNIHLEDALGRTFSLQYEHFRHWPLVQARLELAFSGLQGEQQIRRETSIWNCWGADLGRS